MTRITKTSARLRRLIADLRRNVSGVALTEFAFTLPIFLTLGMLGSETANYVVTHMRVSQIAMQVADNASRIGEQNVLVARKITEGDIDDMLVGADKLAGNLGIYGRGRIVLSSLEQNASGGQWIHWQRCRGMKAYDSKYGTEGTGASGTSFPGMGQSGAEIMASPGTAVMFAEVTYEYRSLTPFSIMEGNPIRYTAAFNVRDSRDLSQIYQTTPASPVADCTKYTN